MCRAHPPIRGKQWAIPEEQWDRSQRRPRQPHQTSPPRTFHAWERRRARQLGSLRIDAPGRASLAMSPTSFRRETVRHAFRFCTPLRPFGNRRSVSCVTHIRFFVGPSGEGGRRRAQGGGAAYNTLAVLSSTVATARWISAGGLPPKEVGSAATLCQSVRPSNLARPTHLYTSTSTWKLACEHLHCAGKNTTPRTGLTRLLRCFSPLPVAGDATAAHSRDQRARTVRGRAV